MRIRRTVTALLPTGALLAILSIVLPAGESQPPMTAKPSTEPPTVPAAHEDGKLRIIAFGAHPDDCELKIGGAAMKWAALGHHVKFVSVTNGDIGHQVLSGGPLARRRKAEVEEVARIYGITVQVLDHHDGEILPTLDNRREIVRLIREWNADMVFTHRPNDYHPDHRYTSTLVQDAAFMVIVPNFCPDTPALRKNPVFFYFSDGFQKPIPFKADVAVDTDDVAAKKFDAAAAIESQFLEWEPWLDGILDRVPQGKAERRAFIEKRFEGFFRADADANRKLLGERYGEEKARGIRYAEAFEVCEYGSRPDARELKRLFPF